MKKTLIILTILNYFVFANDVKLIEENCKINDICFEYKYGTVQIIDGNKENVLELEKKAKNGDINIASYLSYMYLKKGVNENLNKAFEFSKIAAISDKYAQINLAAMYINGIVVEQNLYLAKKYLELSSKQGFKDATKHLKILCDNASYVCNKNLNENSTLQEKCNLGDDVACDNLAKTAYQNKNFEDSLKYYKILADKNNTISQYNVGMFFENGLGTKIDINKAIYYYELSAKNGNKNAQNNLGVIYENGVNGKINYEKAIEYYTLASNQNFEISMFNLAYLHLNGLGTKKDLNKAIDLYLKSANNGHSESYVTLGSIYLNGESIEKDPKKSFDFFNKAANLNNPKAYYNLGVLYYLGSGTEQNLEKMLINWKKAAELGHPIAKQNMESICKNNIELCK